MRCSIKIINPKDQADTAEPIIYGRREVLRQQKRVIIGNISACLRGPVNWGAEKNKDRGLPGRGLLLLCHLSCVPKKGDPKKGTRRKFFTACSIVLSTFRKLCPIGLQTVRNASPSDSIACLNFRMGGSKTVKTPKLLAFQNPLHPMNRFAHKHAMLDKDN